jgi:hypothetical protein
MRVAFFAAVVVVGAAPKAKQIGQAECLDGGVAARFMQLPDGGVYEQWPATGKVNWVPSRVEPSCVLDGGDLIEMLKERKCAVDSDCTIVRPEVDAENVPCCEAIFARVATSAEYEHAHNEAGWLCGWVTQSCFEDCLGAKCIKGRCQAVRRKYK